MVVIHLLFCPRIGVGEDSNRGGGGGGDSSFVFPDYRLVNITMVVVVEVIPLLFSQIIDW